MDSGANLYGLPEGGVRSGESDLESGDENWRPNLTGMSTVRGSENWRPKRMGTRRPEGLTASMVVVGCVGGTRTLEGAWCRTCECGNVVNSVILGNLCCG